MKKGTKHILPMYYIIKVEGCLDKKWADWFEGMAMSCEGEVTVLEGPVKDQAALHGLLARVRDLNLILISVERVEQGQKRKK
ncbi:MAG: hypothetical protein OEY25_01470 [Candidatus Aminicenantes bacterium]|nr:hypothetical protein [Candidatus Aminicenantes bacterium]MDH5466070.1 hypothetical protein [Candidatus Aminicenantes bacterium]